MVLTLGLKKYYKKKLDNSKKTLLLVDKRNRFDIKETNSFTKKDLIDNYLFFLSSDGNLILVK